MKIPLRLLNAIEKIGNKLPRPTLLFVLLGLVVIVLSWICSLLAVQAMHPVTTEHIMVVNLISGEGARQMLLNAVSNFTTFAPLGTVLVAMLGIGIAERSGLLAALLRNVVTAVPKSALTSAVVLAGILSSIAADTGYVVLIPLAALVFKSAGRAPLAGIAASFAGVSAGFSANIIIGPLDVILAGISTESIQLIHPEQSVSPISNWYFIIISTVVLTMVATWVTTTFVEPRLAKPQEEPGQEQQQEQKAEEIAEKSQEQAELEYFAMYYTIICGAVMLALLLLATVPEDGILRNQMTGSITDSPFMSSIVVIISVFAGIMGVVYGYVARIFREGEDVVFAMESSMRDMARYMVPMFFASQFIAWFDWTNLGIILAINGAAVLQTINPGTVPLMIMFILATAIINLFIGSSSAKWVLMAPVFVPMLALSGISPEITQMAYRIGDSSTNIITPLMPYFAIVLAFTRKYKADTGIGTLIAMMLPYSMAFIIIWTIMFAIWIGAGIPLGPA